MSTVETDGLIELQARLFAQSRAGSLPQPDIMSVLLDPRNLDAAWDRVRHADGANTPGVDGLTAGELNGRADEWMRGWASEIRKGAFRHAPARRVSIAKDNGSTRTLGILTLRDRVLHTAIKQALEPLVEPVFSPGSFGFRPGRSVHDALKSAVESLSSTSRPPFQFAVRLDIVDCFETLDHEILLERIERVVDDAAFLKLLRGLLAASGTPAGHPWWRRIRGVIQGSALSPLLCNLYLHPLDQHLEQLARASGVGVRAYRYADDMLILARDRRLARRARRELRAALRGLRMRLNNRKTRACSVEDGFEWLGLRVERRAAPWAERAEFSYVVPTDRVIKMLHRIREITAPPSSRVDADAFNLPRWIASLNTQLRDWRAAYLYAENAPVVFRALDEHARECVAELFHSVLGVRRRDMIRSLRVRLPRGFWTWEIDGVRLVNLASLAPHAPRRTIRKPAWQRSFRPSSAGKQAHAGASVAAPDPADTREEQA